MELWPAGSSVVGEIARRILYEDNHLLVINKLCGELVQGDKTGDISLLENTKEFIKKRNSKPGNVFLGLVHRLDRPSSGVLVFAKTSKALSRMNALFKNAQVQKTYWALVDSAPPHREGLLEGYLLKDEKKNKSRAYAEDGKGRKKAGLSYRLLHQSQRYFLLEIRLHSGRHHQIRAQLQAVGIHIRGDLKYGAARSNPQGGISLHARKIGFVHPVGRSKIEIEADPRLVQDDRLWQKLQIY